MRLLTVNAGRTQAVEYSDRPTAIDKRPVEGTVWVTDPGPSGVGGSGLARDMIGDLRHHGGSEQAVYAYAREELDFWERELDRALPNGSFGENLTTIGVEVSDALVGERWRIGERLVLEVTDGRIPCRTFAGWLGEKGWVKRFTRHARTGAYLRVIEPGGIQAGDPVEIVHRPDHGVTASMAFRAVTTERSLLPEVLAAGDALHPLVRKAAHEYLAKYRSA
ncbi:MOSC domain-containing protein [Streptomyces jumonjinensis]|uniref:MOSC domain-containing protein n=1 Tax=Streptomyces jumonjinensis TaxID=1945 RepID=UPI0037B9F08C